MEEEPTDPHEQQLFLVYKSCITKGQNKLNEDGLLDLCGKLELDQNHKEVIFELLQIKHNQKLISFDEFRDAFVILLDKFQKTTVNGLEKEVVNGESDIFSKNNTMCTKETKCQQNQTDKILSHQKLQETWTNQSSLTDVNSFFNTDLALSKKAIQVIFEKLDRDCDGLINLNEFLNFFESSNKLLEQFGVSWSSHLQRDLTKSVNCKDFVSYQTCPTPRCTIVELWEVSGISNANSFLLDLGFSGPTINLIDLSNALSSELKLHRDVSHTKGTEEYMRLLKGALALYQDEVRNLNLSIEHLRCERDKLRSDIGEANERANLFAQEMDDQQARMDKFRVDQLRQLELRHAEMLKNLSDQQHVEREKNLGAIKSIEEQLQASQFEESKLRTELASVSKELKELESESQNQIEVIQKLETNNGQLSLQVRELAAAREQVENTEIKENDHVAELSDHIKRLQTEIKVLRDHNDELTSELEMLKHRDNDAKSVVSSVDVRSMISDENDGIISMISDTEDEDKHQRFSDHSKVIKPLHGTITRNKPTLDDSSSSDSGSLNKLSEIIQEFRNFLTGAKFCSECSILRSEVSSLISELELYQSSMPISVTATRMTTKSTAAQTISMSNKRWKHLKTLANELEENNINEFEAISKSEKLNHSKQFLSSNDAINTLEKSLGNLELDDKNEFSASNDKDNNNSITEIVEKAKHILNQNIAKPNKELEKVLAEKQLLHDRCANLEKSLELLRTEYEKCEDYWESKLEEERQLFEQEQKITDDKFTDLLVKMSEYEEQFSSDDKRKGNLSPIEEQGLLEQQYTSLEAEFERLKLDAQEELNRKEEEIEELKIKLARGDRQRESLKDNAVQFPEEQMKNIFPAFSNTLGSLPSDSMDSRGVDKVDATILVNQKVESTSQCFQCHNIMQKACNCHANNQRQSQQQQSQHQSRDHKSKHRAEGKNRHHHHHHQKKPDMDYELMNLVKQKEKIKQEITRLQNYYKAMSANQVYPFITSAEQNVVSNLYAKLFAQEQKHKYLQFCLSNQHRESERIIQNMWKQHITETQDLRLAIKNIEDKLKYQIRVNKEQNEKLAKGDVLTKELYLENAKLTDMIKRLEEHCQILTQNRIESTK